MKSFDCDSVLEQLSDFIDADAREELCQAIAEHMSHCRDCRVMVDTVKKTIVLYQNGATTEVPIRATDQLGAALAREYAARK
ncbi:MAG: zf-HC2 domain-containing protein [Candidatus Eiseniibacteriota bacterium]